MNLNVVQEALSQQRADAWIVFTFNGKPVGLASGSPVDRRLLRMVRGWIKTTDYRGRPNEISVFPTWESLPAKFVMLAGLGSRGDFHAGRLRRAAASAFREAARLDLGTLAVSLAAAEKDLRISKPELAHALVDSLYAGQYDFVRFFSSRGRRRTTPRGALTLTDAGRQAADARTSVRDAARSGEIAAEVRELANLPGNEAPPAVIARAARRLAAKHGVACRVMDWRELQRKGCHALLAVSRGSNQEPCLITLKYRGANPNLKPVVLVGKTITFDTGGISLKPPKGMEWMKYDKCGGMAVLAATLMAARLKFRRPVIGILAAAENMPGGRATRPGDIVRSHAGKTIEILNTDAEGRLVLADALSLASEHNPEAIVDLATLTGAVIVALGHTLAAVMGNNEKLVARLQEAGGASGDRLWPLPLLPEYAEGLRGQFADLKNVTADGAAGTIVGGAFLRSFVPERIPWAHIDIAGTAWEEKEQAYAAAGATLFGANLLTQWIRTIEPAR